MVKNPVDHALANRRVINNGGDLYAIQAALFSDQPFCFSLDRGERIRTQLLGASRLKDGDQWDLWGTCQFPDKDQSGLWLAHYQMTPDANHDRGSFIYDAQPILVMNSGRPGYTILSGPGRQSLMTAFMSGDLVTMTFYNHSREEKMIWQVASLERHLGMDQWYLLVRAETNNMDPPQLALYNPYQRKGTYYPSFRPGS